MSTPLAPGQPSHFSWTCDRPDLHAEHRVDGDGYYGPDGYVCYGRPDRPTIYDEIRAERERAHAKHGDTSMELAAIDEMYRGVILGEEVGEVAEAAAATATAAVSAAAAGRVQRVLNDGRHDRHTNLAELRKELVQVGAMAAAWADRIPTG